ncbi:TOMM precursor leader peptide-binding protein [Nonomuraea sp. NPDC052265]|uniref:TOMM precursor leader peptide-binding protein n=1 Tax=Nonomuraea sp. NPDC052265 TaxID=3364374 RepID=UPI0037CB3314
MQHVLLRLLQHQHQRDLTESEPLPDNDRLPARPWLPAWYRMSTMPPGTVRLDSLTRSFALDHVPPALLQRLLPLLDGTRPVEDIRTRLAAHDADPATVDDLLRALHANGLLQDGPPAPTALTAEEQEWWRQQADFFGHFSAASDSTLPARPDVLPSGRHYQARLREAVVAVLGCGRLGSQVARDLATSGVGELLCVDDGTVTEEAARADAWYDPGHRGRPAAEVVCELIGRTSPHCRAVPVGSGSWEELLDRCDAVVLAPDVFRPADHEALNTAALSSRTPWTSCRTVGLEVLIGPTVLPGRSACWTCFDDRRRSHLTRHEEATLVEHIWGEADRPPPFLAVVPGLSLVTLEVVKLLTGFAPATTVDGLLAVDVLSSTTTLHPVLRVPRCRSCGRPAQDRPALQVWDVEGVR